MSPENLNSEPSKTLSPEMQSLADEADKFDPEAAKKLIAAEKTNKEHTPEDLEKEIFSLHEDIEGDKEMETKYGTIVHSLEHMIEIALDQDEKKNSGEEFSEYYRLEAQTLAELADSDDSTPFQKVAQEFLDRIENLDCDSADKFFNKCELHIAKKELFEKDAPKLTAEQILDNYTRARQERSGNNSNMETPKMEQEDIEDDGRDEKTYLMFADEANEVKNDPEAAKNLIEEIESSARRMNNLATAEKMKNLAQNLNEYVSEIEETASRVHFE